MMIQKEKAARIPSENVDRRGLSQLVFVVLGLGIITGGMWSLYMDDAPYHPDGHPTHGEILVSSD